MDRGSTIRTKIRPVKKLFLIEENSVSQFLEIVQSVSLEVTGLTNIILVNNSNIFSENTYQFINRHDPDVVINYTSLNNEEITDTYKIPAFSGDQIDSILTSLSTPFYTLDNLPYPLKFEKSKMQEGVYACFKNSFDATNPFSLMNLLHFGIIDENYKDILTGSLFAELFVAQIESLEQFFQILDFRETSFLYNLMDLVNWGEGSSIWHLNFNPDNLFKDKPTVILGSKDNLKSMVYFWNIRATYPYSRTIWFPIELINGNEHHLRTFKYCCAFANSDEAQSLIREIGLNTIDSSKYYFGTYIHEWETFENIQNVSVIDGKVRINHPFDKLFSRAGFNVNFVLEVSGLPELHLPKSLELGKLFVTLPDDDLFKHYFARTHRLGLSLYCDYFEPYRQIPIVRELTLPTEEAIFLTLFREHGLDIKETPGTSVTKEAIQIFGGYEGLGLIVNREIFNLIVKLAPKRLEKIMEALSRQIQTDDQTAENLRVLLSENPSVFTTINSDIIVNIDKISSMLPIRREDRNTIYPLIQELYNRHVLLRGKSFTCPYCKSKLWYALESFQEENKCYGCNKPIQIPIFSGDQELGDFFKLNELISIAVDQGVLPLILVIYYLFRQPFYSKRFLYDYDIYSLNSSELLAEIDLIITLGDKLGLAEVKSDRGFPNDQIDRLLDVANRVKASFLVFSTLKNKDSEEVRSLLAYLGTKKLQIPAFIITEEVLFNKSLVNVGKFFEIPRGENKFPIGPIFLAEMSRI